MRFRAVLGVAVVVAAVLAVGAPGLVVGQSPAGETGTAPGAASNTTIVVHPHPNGDARVRIETRYALDSDADTAAFRGLGRDFEAGRVGTPVSTFRWAANESSIATGRSMNVTNATRNATIVGAPANETRTGRLTLGFTWTAFATTTDDRIVVGDAFNGTRGTWLPALTETQALVIESPKDYFVLRSPPGASISNGTVRFDGPATFSAGTPVVWLGRRSGSPATRGPPTPESGLFGSIPPLAVGTGVLVVGVGVVVLGAYALARRDGNVANDDTDRTPASSGEAIGENAGDGSGGVATPLEDELLSDEERVERLLTANDGRMKQASIVDATGWSNAKVSQLLSAMDEAGRVNKLRIGRENLISLPDEE